MFFRTMNSNAPAADTVKLLRAETHTIPSSAAPVHLSGCCLVCSATAPSVNETAQRCCQIPTSKTEESEKIFCLGLPFGEVRNLSGRRG